jgi:hypothetical protein
MAAQTTAKAAGKAATPATAARAEPATPAAAASARTRTVGRAALGALVVLYAAIAALFAAPGSNVVLATAGGSPDWLLGPLRAFGWSGADGAAAGPLLYAGLWLALSLYVVVLASSAAVSARLAIVSILALHLVYLLAPPLLSQDVFSYLSYARLGVLHDLNPYTHGPDAVPSDAAYRFAGSKDATSAYGPLFTVATYPLAKLGVPAAFWTLKAAMATCSLAVVALTWACARRLERDPVRAALVVGLNPLVLVHVVGGAHNDALMVALWLGGLLAILGASTATGGATALAGALSMAAAGIKAAAGIVVPFMLAGTRRRAAFVAGALGSVIAALLVALPAFGARTLDAFVLIGENQGRTTRWSVPQRAADAIAALTGGSADAIVDYTRVVFIVVLAAFVVWLLVRTARGIIPFVDAAAWATLGVLVASAWLVPWYAIWLLPLAALARDRRLLPASIALCAYMLVIAVPL